MHNLLPRTNLRLNGHVGDATLCALATHCSDTLTSVDFERCSITDAGLASLSACSKLINVTLASSAASATVGSSSSCTTAIGFVVASSEIVRVYKVAL